MPFMDRFLYTKDMEAQIDSEGLLVNPAGDSWRYSKLITLEDLADLPGGILLAEGGMGKTRFMQQFVIQANGVAELFEVVEYLNNYSTFENNIQRSQCNILLIDGLDEGVDAAGPIVRLLREHPSKNIWIASRDVPVIQRIQSEFQGLNTYYLAPLSRENLSAYGGDGFLEAVTEQGLLPLCAKPLTCSMAYTLFLKNELTGKTQKDLWHEGILALCGQGHKTCVLDATAEQVLQCSAWIALCATLSSKHLIWDGESGNGPEGYLTIDELFRGSPFKGQDSPLRLLQHTLKCGVFHPLGGGHFAFAHNMYRDYLAAFAWQRWFPKNHWDTQLIHPGFTTVYPGRTAIAAWLAAVDTDFRHQLLATQPEILIASDVSIHAVGAEKLCTELLLRANQISRNGRDSLIRELHHLKQPDTEDVLARCLQDKQASPKAVELAIDIIKSCKYDQLAELLVALALDSTCDALIRKSAAYAAAILGNDTAKTQLKNLLGLSPEQDPEDELRGAALLACWPQRLTPEELFAQLHKPQHTSLYGLYQHFLYNMPEGLSKSILKDNAHIFLRWAVEQFDVEWMHGPLLTLAQSIYAECWQWAIDPTITVLLAQGYAQALSAQEEPFLSKDDTKFSKAIYVTQESFIENDRLRLLVLEAFLSLEETTEDSLFFSFCSHYPLYVGSDMALLLTKAKQVEDPRLAAFWIACIRHLLPQVDINLYAEGIDALHNLYPTHIKNSQQLCIEKQAATIKQKTSEQSREQKRTQTSKKQSATQAQVDGNIKKTLQEAATIDPRHFQWVYSSLMTKKGHYVSSVLDIQQAPGWTKLNPVEQEAFLDLAERYLRDTAPLASQANVYQGATEVMALTALRLLRPDAYHCLPEEVWKRCGVEILKRSRIDDSIDIVAPLCDTLADSFSKAAEEVLLTAVEQEISEQYLSILRNWGQRLTAKQAEKVLCFAQKQQDKEKLFLILRDLAASHFADLARAYLNDIFRKGWETPPDLEYHHLRTLAFQLSPREYISQICAALNATPEWGKGWLEASVDMLDDNKELLQALAECNNDDIASLYIWWHTHCPPVLPNENGGWGTQQDKIDWIRNRLLNYLIENGRQGATVALQRVADCFPQTPWLHRCILEAREAELRNNAPVLTVHEINELCESAEKRWIHSIEDLIEAIKLTLSSYETFLQKGTGAINDLWNRHCSKSSSLIVPKQEEDLSDHLVRYLELTLAKGIIVNREVTISRKMIKDGEPGSRTDVWVQAASQNNKSILTVCIEVKCNWNPSAKSAMKDQLIDRYMPEGNAQGGILLLGWFACEQWSTDSRKKKATRTWSTIEGARTDLEEQAKLERSSHGAQVYSMVIDCSLR